MQTTERVRKVDFCAFSHSITVGGVTKQSERQIRSQSDLLANNKKFVVCRGEIGHEFVEKVISISRKRLTVIDTDDISKIVALVQGGQADIALSDFVSIKNYLDQNKDSSPKLKAVFRRRPLAICIKGVMIPRNQEELGRWLDAEFRDAKKTRK